MIKKARKRKEQADVEAVANRKETENKNATSLSKNVNEAVEKSLAKSSEDEAQSRPS